MTEVETSIAWLAQCAAVVACDWEPLRDGVLRVIARVGGKTDLGLRIINQCLRNGLLELGLTLDGITMTPFSRTDCERRTVHAPPNPAEGVGVEPYAPGDYFVRRAGLAAAPTTKLDAWVAEHGSALVGNRPKEGWNKFYDRCRDDCDGWAYKKEGKPAAGFSNKTIERRLQHAGFKPKPDK